MSGCDCDKPKTLLTLPVPSALRRVQQYTDVTAAAPNGIAASTARPTLIAIDQCDPGLLQFTGTYRNLEISYDSVTFLPLTIGPWPWVPNLSRVYLRQNAAGAVANQTLAVDFWPACSPEQAAIASDIITSQGGGDASLLAEVQDIETDIDTILTNLTTLITQTDTLEALLRDLQDAKIGGIGKARVLINATSTANAAVNADIAAGAAGTRIVVDGFSVFTRGAAVAADVVVELRDGVAGTLLWTGVIGAGEPTGGPHAEMRGTEYIMTAATLARLSVPALGASVIAEVNMSGYLLPATT